MAWIHQRELKRKSRNGKPEIAYYVQWRDAHGKTISSQAFHRLQDARDYKTKEVESKLLTGGAVDPKRGRSTMDEIFGRLLASRVRPKGARRRQDGLAENTKDLFRRHWRLYVEPTLGARRVVTITQADIEGLLSALEPVNPKAKGDSTREHVFRLLNHVLNHAVHEGRIHVNPAANISMSPPKSEVGREMTIAEVDALAAAMPDRYRALVLVGCWGGPRISELTYLHQRHLDEIHRELTIDGAAVAEELTKSGRTRRVPLPAPIWSALSDHLEWFPSESGLVFTTSKGKPINPDNFRSRDWNAAVERAGLMPRPRIHDMRHTAASLMDSVGYTRSQAQEFLGHSSQYMTEHYTHLFREDTTASVRRADRAIEKARRDVARVKELSPGLRQSGERTQ